MTFKNYQDFLENAITYTELYVYTISFIIIAVSVIKASIIYVKLEIENPSEVADKVRLQLSHSFSLALSFIIGVEILKLFYIKNYKQLIIIISLVLIKMAIAYYIEVIETGINNAKSKQP